MKKVLALVGLLALGGCSVYEVAATVDVLAPNATRSVVKGYCNKIKTEYSAALLIGSQLSGQCKAIVRTGAIVNAVQSLCANVDGMSASQLINTYASVRAQWKNAANAVVSGC
jgi:hypothetical protein